MYAPTRTNDHISDAPGEEPIVCQSKIAKEHWQGYP